MSELKAETIIPQGTTISLQMYPKGEADKVIADLEESHKMEVEQLLMEIVKLKADYKEACDRLQTANLIKDEQLAATRHQKYKRCLAMAKSCKNCAEMFGCMASHERLKFGKTPYYQKCSLHANIQICHEKKWLELAEQFKEAK